MAIASGLNRLTNAPPVPQWLLWTLVMGDASASNRRGLGRCPILSPEPAHWAVLWPLTSVRCVDKHEWEWCEEVEGGGRSCSLSLLANTI